MSYETLTYEFADGVGTITLDRPDAANSLNAKMGEELLEVATHCDSDPSVRAVILTGKGKMFCAGGDLKSFVAQGDKMGEHMRYLTTGLHAAVSRFARMNAPLIVAVNGTAAGAGFSLSIIGDLIYAGESAKFTEAYTRIGVSPDGSSSYFLPRLVGPLMAKRLILLNDLLTAEQAKDMGLVVDVFPDDELMAKVTAIAKEFAQGPTKAFGEAKRLVVDSLSNTLETQMEMETRAIAGLATYTHDAKEGMTAFTEKRKPNFKGE
ncbi:MAG: enoyl-CoA hydratase-related protein [Pseudomonadota bacterium]